MKRVHQDEDYVLQVTEDAPTNTVGGGHIAGVGVGDQGEPAGKKKTSLLRRKKTLKQFMSGT